MSRVTYFAVCENGTEVCSNYPLFRAEGIDGGTWSNTKSLPSVPASQDAIAAGLGIVILPSGSIESLFGKEMTYSDDPYTYIGL